MGPERPCSSFKPRTVAHYQAMLDDHLLPSFGGKRGT